MRKYLVIIFFQFIVTALIAQPEDSVFIRKIYTESLTNGKSYEDLRKLCKNIGNRISGSKQANKAVDYTYQLMKDYGFDTVYKQQIMVPNWKRGKKQELLIRDLNNHQPNQEPMAVYKPKITALGGSVGTAGLMSGDVVMVNSFDELKLLGKDKINGKIVFFNIKWEHYHIHTFKGYGSCVVQRSIGADAASKFGAKAVMIRSVTPANDENPHTGSLHYTDSVARIPAFAVSTNYADKIEASINKGHKIIAEVQMNCEWKADTISYNVIGELKGLKNPENIIAVGGHLDSWDIGEGAHDDGAGCIHSIEAVRLLKTLGYVPNNTLRVIMFMNEENGLRGGKHYAQVVKNKNEKHIAAIESDAGGLVPRGFSTEKEEYVNALKKFAPIFKPYGLHYFEKGGSGADVGQMSGSTDGALIGFVPDSQRYFDYHHAATDVFENIHKRELELGCASISTLMFLIDKKGLK